MFTLHDKARDVMQCVRLGAHNRAEVGGGGEPL